MADVKVFVLQDNKATIVCPHCNSAKQVSLDGYRNKGKTLKVRCKCKETFTVELDFRNYYRKQTNLAGTYRSINPPGGGGPVNVCNLSLGGMGFTVAGMHSLQPGHTIEVEFRLDDKNFSKLVKRARVCTIQKNYIGCQFPDQERAGKELGFYLRF